MSNHREYWRRRDEQYWRSKDEGRRVYGEMTRNIRESENAARRHRLNAEYLGSEIKSSEDTAKAAQHLESMQRQKSFILNQISTCGAARRNWHERLDSVSLINPGATDQLQDLLQEVESNKIIWSKFPDPWASFNRVTGLNWQVPNIQDLQSPRARRSLDAVQLRFEQQEEQRETQRQLNESSLGLIASSLSLLISEMRAYHSRSF